MAQCNIRELYGLLYAYFGPQHWWPAQSKFEVCVGAILTQNTAWQNVEKAIANLRKAKKLSLQGLLSLDEKELAGLIKSAGYYNQKAKRLRIFCEYVKRNYSCSLKRFFNKPLPKLREELLSLHGIGQETADSIILYAAGKPTFVVDAYTARIIERVCNVQFKSRAELKQFFESALAKNATLYNEYHALFVALAKNFCRKKPLCRKCPINKKCYYFKNKAVQDLV